MRRFSEMQPTCGGLFFSLAGCVLAIAAPSVMVHAQALQAGNCSPIGRIILPVNDRTPTVSVRLPMGSLIPPANASAAVMEYTAGANPTRSQLTNNEISAVTWTPPSIDPFGVVGITIDRQSMELGRDRAIVLSWKDAADNTDKIYCVRTTFSAPVPLDAKATWLVNGSDVGPVLPRANLQDGSTRSIRISGHGLWDNTIVALDPNMDAISTRVSYIPVADTMGDAIITRVAFNANYIAGGRYRLSLKTAAADWHDGITVRVQVASEAPVVATAAPAEISSGATSLEVTLKGANFAHPTTVSIGFTPNGSIRVPFLTVLPADPTNDCPAASCIKVLAPMSPPGRDGTLDFTVTNFDGIASAATMRKTVRVVSSITTTSAWSSSLAAGNWVRGGSPVDITLADNTVTISHVEIDEVVVSPTPRITSTANTATIHRLTFASPSGDSSRRILDIVKMDGSRTRAKVLVYADPTGFDTVALYGMPNKVQPLAIRGRHLSGLSVQSVNNAIKLDRPATTATQFTADATPLTTGGGRLEFYRENVLVGALDVPARNYVPLKDLIRVTTGKPDCSTPGAADAQPSLKIETKGKVCVTVLETRLANVHPAVADSLIITVEQNEKVLSTTAMRSYLANAGTGVSSETVLLPGVEEGSDLQIIARRGNDKYPIKARVALTDKIGALAGFTVTSYAIGRRDHNVYEKSYTTAATPQVGMWFAPFPYNRNWKGFAVAVPSKREYCEGQSKDVLSLAVGGIYRDRLTFGLGTPVEQGRIPTLCQASTAADAPRAAEGESVAFRRLLLLLSIKAS